MIKSISFIVLTHFFQFNQLQKIEGNQVTSVMRDKTITMNYYG